MRKITIYLIIVAGILLSIYLLSRLYFLVFEKAVISPPAKTSMEMVYIPAGNFLMGSEKSDRNQRPQHKVFLDAFWIDQTEVTNSQYQVCLNEGACGNPHEVEYFKDTKYSSRPAIYISWEEAQIFCAWAGKRLPTEAEWEKAARGDDGRTYPWGNQKPNSILANYYDNKNSSSEVGSYPAGASPYGAMDMAGNVWEWTADWYGPEYYKTSPVRNPTGPASGDRRIVRGGSWLTPIEIVMRTYFRKALDPEKRNYTTGFRCAWSE